jgi:AcrR family transcriptional regulator
VSSATKDGGRPAGTRIRKNRETRHAEIVATAREVFAANGYAQSGLAEVASAAKVSKGLLYHYFPEGRPQLFVSVIEELVTELQVQLRQASKGPFSSRTRMSHMLGALFAFFDENPAAYRLLFRDPWVTHDDTVEAAAIATRAQFTSDLTALLAGSASPPDELLAASSGILGFALANVDLCLAGQLEPEVAWRVTVEYCTAKLDD